LMASVAFPVVEHDFVNEQRFVMYGVPWQIYLSMRDALDERASLKMTYLEGALELMSPSFLHEDAKRVIGRLLDAWAMEYDVDLRGFGGATLRSEPQKRGLEPDECYKLGPLRDGDVPDIAIEVIGSNALLNKMAVYAGLGVPEVWTWRTDSKTVVVHRLVGEAYELRERSEILPTLDLTLLSSFVKTDENQTRLAKAYLAALRAR
jgi:Uma2 family endonuclease